MLADMRTFSTTVAAFLPVVLLPVKKLGPFRNAGAGQPSRSCSPRGKMAMIGGIEVTGFPRNAARR